MRYRLRLGKEDELVYDDIFSSSGSWSVGANWSIGAGIATHAGGTGLLPADLMILSNIFEVGEQYRIDIIYRIPSANSALQIYIGEFSINELLFTSVVAGFTSVSLDFSQRCLAGTSLTLRAVGDVEIDRLTIYKKVFNEPTEEGFILNGANIKLQKSTKAEPISLKTAFIENMTLFADNYDFLLAKYNTLKSQSPSEFCEFVESRIEKKELDNTWSTLYEGNIIVSDISIDYRKKIIEADIENYANEAIQNNLDKNFVFTALTPFRVVGNTLTTITREVLFTDPGGTCQYPKLLFDVFFTLRQLIHEATSLRMTLEMPVFETGTFQYFSLSTPLNLRTDVGVAPYTPKPENPEIQGSFSLFVADLNKLFNLDGYVKNDFSVPTLLMNSYSSLIGSLLNIVKDNNIGKFEFDVAETYELIDVGYDKDHELINANANDWHIKKFNSQQRCATGTLDLVSGFWASRYALDSFIDEAVNTNPIQFDYRDDDIVYVEVFDDSGTFKAGTSSTCGLYNTNIESRDNVDRWETRLKTDYKAIVEETLKVNDPYIRVWDEFEVGFNWSEIEDILDNPFYELTMSSSYFNTVNGQIIEMTYPLENESDGQKLSTIKLLTP